MTGIRQRIEEYGHEGVMSTPWGGFADARMVFPLKNFYRVEGVCTQGDRKGSECSYRACNSITAARKLLAEVSVEDADKYNEFYIVCYQPALRMSVVDDDDDDLLG